MPEYEEILRGLDAPTDRPTRRLDVRELPPPEPLRETLETLAAADGDVVVVQLNDRPPQFLFPKLEDRGYAYAVAEGDGDDPTVTAIWAEE